MRDYKQEYRDALDERDNFSVFSKEWNEMTEKIFDILRDGVKAHDDESVYIVKDEIESLLDCEIDWNDEEIQKDVELLEANGYDYIIKRIKKMYEID